VTRAGEGRVGAATRRRALCVGDVLASGRGGGRERPHRPAGRRACRTRASTGGRARSRRGIGGRSWPVEASGSSSHHCFARKRGCIVHKQGGVAHKQDGPAHSRDALTGSTTT
jgi:hypothetical protein